MLMQMESTNIRRGGTFIQRWRVPLGFACALLFAVLARPRLATLIVGGILSIMGLALRAWAAGHIRKNDALATSGPYAYTRNPLYLGSLLLGLGFTIAAARWELAFVFVALFVGIYFPVMRVEASTLAGLFGESYQRYAREVPLYVPRLTPYRDQGAEGRFDVRLYMRYREYRAGLGLLIAWAFLALRSYYLK
jgi:protein-S-isoprenylcysteine O-methyltransferase Ste14